MYDGRVAVRRELMTETLLERAAQLFSENGFDRTSLQDIATAMGLSRPALYHYIDSKEDLLERLVSELTDAERADEERLRARTDLSPVETLREFIRMMTLRVTQRPHRFRLLVMAEASLSQPVMAAHARLKRRMLDLAVEIVRDVAATGQMKPVDPLIVGLSIIGMTNWLAWWFSPDGKLSGEAIAEQFATIVMDGVLVDGGSENGAGVAGALTRLRQDVAHLESLIGTGS
jgi:AcrR family transcriptional regulator